MSKAVPADREPRQAEADHPRGPQEVERVMKPGQAAET